MGLYTEGVIGPKQYVPPDQWGWVCIGLDLRGAESRRKNEIDNKLFIKLGTVSQDKISSPGKNPEKWNKYATMMGERSWEKMMAYSQWGIGVWTITADNGRKGQRFRDLDMMEFLFRTQSGNPHGEYSPRNGPQNIYRPKQ